MRLLRYFLTIIIASVAYGLAAQTLFNNGQQIWMNNQAVVFVDGDFTNQLGKITISESDGASAGLSIHGNLLNNDKITGNGTINLYGNWTNNLVFVSGEAWVNFLSNNHTLGGTAETHFFNVNLNADGIKTLTNSQHIHGVLNLGASEINTQANALYIENTDASSIFFTTGFVSSAEGGFLSRKMQSLDDYIFPLGNNFDNQVLRPVIITPSVAELSQFNGRFANINPDDEGYYTSLKGDSINFVNDTYFHIINRAQGANAVKLKIEYDAADGDFDHVATWGLSPTPAWRLINDSYVVESISANFMTIDAINNFANPQFVLCNKTEAPVDTIPDDDPEDIDPEEEDIIIYNSFSPNGDSFNDTWIVENCENCSVKIFNRNGNLVFESLNNADAWDGTYKANKVPDATYYYIINPGNNRSLLKGSVTIIR